MQEFLSFVEPCRCSIYLHSRRPPSGIFQNTISRFTSCVISLEQKKCRIEIKGDSENLTVPELFRSFHLQVVMQKALEHTLRQNIYIYASGGGNTRR